MSISTLAADERVADVEITEDELTVRLMDGRAISVPIVWYPRLLNATEEQRKNWRISGGGYGIHWEDIDEDLSTNGLLRGIPASRQSSSAMHTAQSKEDGPSYIPAESDAHEKGVLDYFVDVEEASNELLTLLLDIASQIENITSKVVRRTASISGMADTVTGVKASDINNVVLLLAAEISDFSKGIEGATPKLERNTQILEENLSMYVSLAQPEDGENIEQLHILKETLSALLESVRSSKENIGIFKEEVESVRNRKFSYAMNKATARQSDALNGLIASIEGFESFALRIMFQIDEKLGQA
jgi:hypothetical protein